MKINLKKLLVIASLVLASTSASAETFDDGVIAFIKGDGAAAYKIWKPLADNGDSDAQYHLGYMYQTGTGIDTDKSKALYWYDKAAKNGHGKAFVLSKVIERELKR